MLRTGLSTHLTDFFLGRPKGHPQQLIRTHGGHFSKSGMRWLLCGPLDMLGSAGPALCILSACPHRPVQDQARTWENVCSYYSQPNPNWVETAIKISTVLAGITLGSQAWLRQARDVDRKGEGQGQGLPCCHDD